MILQLAEGGPLCTSRPTMVPIAYRFARNRRRWRKYQKHYRRRFPYIGHWPLNRMSPQRGARWSGDSQGQREVTEPQHGLLTAGGIRLRKHETIVVFDGERIEIEPERVASVHVVVSTEAHA